LVNPAPPVTSAAAPVPVDDSAGHPRLGHAEFHPHTGRLVRLAGLDVDGPFLDVWRAPTDNDAPLYSETWRRHGLHRMRHRTDDVRADGDALMVRGRVAPAGWTFGLLTAYRWAAANGAVRLDVEVTPDGPWPDFPLPRLGLRLELPADIDKVIWYGAGPGEAYPDTRQAARVGRYRSSVDDLQTPYVFPQENGHRSDVRWVELTLAGRSGGLRIEGSPLFGLTARRWTSADLDAAKHHHELRPREHVYVNLDLEHHGIGSGSCGPGPLEKYHLTPGASRFALTFRSVNG
jgi:beta-galactosidase